MSSPKSFPEEVGTLYRLRLKHPDRLYSELIDAFHLARAVMPDGALEDLETIASYILEKAAPPDPVA